jgi:UDP-glucuronate 4-epimerase
VYPGHNDRCYSSSMRVLLTGGAGFVGSHVAERLLRQGDTLTIVDDLNEFYSPEVKRQNLAQVSMVGPCEFIHADICDAERMASVMTDARPDVVIHLAGRAGVRPSLADPLLYERVNVQGTITLLEACRRMGTRKFVFASSSSIYGIANQVPFREDDGLNLPISPYAATKIAGEKICYTYSHLYGLEVTCLRFFTVYGPRQRPDLAIRKFTEMIYAGRPIPVFGDGSSGRDYTYVDDIVDGILAAIDYQCSYEIFNLGNSKPVSLITLIQTIEEACARRAVIDRQPLQPGDVPITYADISKAHRLLGYEPRVPFPTGIAAFVDWFRREHASAGKGIPLGDGALVKA